MFQEYFLRHCRFHYKLCEGLGFLPYAWDEQENIPKVTKIKRRKWIANAYMILSILYVAMLGYQTLRGFTGNASIASRYQSVAIFAGFLTIAVVRTDWSGTNDLSLCYSTLIQFEKKLQNVQPIRYSRVEHLFGSLLPITFPITMFVMIGMIFALVIIFPCLPPFLASFIVGDETKKCMHILKNWWYLVTVFDMFATMHLLFVGYFYVFHTVMPWTICFLKYIFETFRFQSQMTKMGGNDLLRQQIVLHSLYSNLELLVVQFNACMRERILFGMMMLIPFVEIFGLFVALRYGHQLGIEELLLFVTVGFDGVIVNVIVQSMAAFISHKSTILLTKCAGKLKIAPVKKRKDNKYVERLFGGCKPLTIRFGNNFVERKTPLVVQDFCFSQIASMLLLSRN